LNVRDSALVDVPIERSDKITQNDRSIRFRGSNSVMTGLPAL
jgi:hypothetical protein